MHNCCIEYIPLHHPRVSHSLKQIENVIKYIYSLLMLSTLILNAPWYAPHNHNLLFPWIRPSSDEASDAATDGIGWLVDHLYNISLGLVVGFKVKRNGSSCSLISFYRFIQKNESQDVRLIK